MGFLKKIKKGLKKLQPKNVVGGFGAALGLSKGKKGGSNDMFGFNAANQAATNQINSMFPTSGGVGDALQLGARLPGRFGSEFGGNAGYGDMNRAGSTGDVQVAQISPTTGMRINL